MTEFFKKTVDTFMADHNKETHDDNPQDQCEMHGSSESSDSEESAQKSESSPSSGSWSIDDSIEFVQALHKPLFTELPLFSLRSVSPSGHSLSSNVNEPISLFNLSISPISSMDDLSRIKDQNICSAATEQFTKDLAQANDSTGSGYDEDERISLDDITAQINTPPPSASKANKRLNLETIFEDVFLETPKKRRFNGFKRFNSWRIEERISSYVIEQQQNNNHDATRFDTTNTLCTAFDDQINLNT